MILKILCSLVFIVLASGQPNYQERNVYYSEGDNVCRYTESSDKVNLIINIDDKDRVKKTIRGGTWCANYYFAPYANMITTTTMMYQIDDDNNQFFFDQVETRNYRHGLLADLILKVTMHNSTKINGISYNCTIFGDGTVHHFGTEFSTDPAQVYLRCLSTGKPASISKSPKNLNEQGKIHSNESLQ